MGETSNGMQASTSKQAVVNGKITCHLVRLPQIVLTRIDESQFPLQKLMSSPIKKPLKKLTANKKKSSLVQKTSVKKLPTNKPRGRPKKEISINLKGTKLNKKVTNNNVESTGKLSVSKSSKKDISKPQNSIVKNMLKKTMLQKRSKIVIPATKKAKTVIKNKQTKLISPKPKKLVPSKIKFDLPNESIDLDTSEDEFLYDELIEELENTKRRTVSTDLVYEKTTNIILKPNIGNKPPTVVKGGIIKRENLPADLKPIASTDTFYKSKETKTVFAHTVKNITKEKPTNTKLLHSLLGGTGGNVTPSPWPSTSPPQESTIPAFTKKIKQKTKKSNAVVPIKNKASNSRPPPKKRKLNSSSIQSKPSTNPNVFDPEPISLDTAKPKIGPKMTAKVTPTSKSISPEDNLSDEYTEEETLENIDSDLDQPTKDADVSIKDEKISQVTNIPNVSSQTKSSYDNEKNDEDPHLDLLRILTDDSDEPMPLESIEPTETNSENKKNDSSNATSKTRNEIDAKSTSELTNTAHSYGSSATSNETDEEPKVRTIYDLMSEISLHYPSWNLHIIPETNAFCIAQVTKGRLGLPTLKKCIELDPNNYNAKVYIHQYHIKRFDGVYDSEESIIALIQEINSIKA